MTISNIEIIQILQTRCSKLPLTGGPSSALKSSIAQTMPFELSTSSTQPTTQIMDLTAIYIATGQLITNINFVSSTTAAGTPTNWWYALYDDGRNATSLSLLSQTADQGSAAFAANTNIGLALIPTYTTTYSGIYYVGFMMKATAVCTLAGITRSSISIQISGSNVNAIFAGTAGSGLTTTAPNPSGTVTAASRTNFAYIS